MSYNLACLDDIINIVNNFTRKFDCEAFPDTDFWVDIYTNEVHFALVCSENSEKEFMESVYRCNPKVKMDIFLWSLLHEIFHVETFDDLTQEEIDYSEDTKDLIKRGLVDHREYYNLPIEQLATESAVKYANSST